MVGVAAPGLFFIGTFLFFDDCFSIDSFEHGLESVEQLEFPKQIIIENWIVQLSSMAATQAVVPEVE